jgi:hypothetical protein
VIRALATLFQWGRPEARPDDDPLGEFLLGTGYRDVSPEVLLGIL